VALSAQECKLVVVEDTELDYDLVRDMTETLTSFWAPLHGRHAAKNTAAAGVSAPEAA
jgi:putative resolvase